MEPADWSSCQRNHLLPVDCDHWPQSSFVGLFVVCGIGLDAVGYGCARPVIALPGQVHQSKSVGWFVKSFRRSEQPGGFASTWTHPTLHSAIRRRVCHVRTPTSEQSQVDHGETISSDVASLAPQQLTNAPCALVEDVIHGVVPIEAAAWGLCPAAGKHGFGNQTILEPLTELSWRSAVHLVLEVEITPCKQLRDQQTFLHDISSLNALPARRPG